MDDLYFKITVNATGVSHDISSEISTLSIEEQNGRPDKLTMTMSDQYKVYAHALQAGMGVEVDLGTDSDHSIVFMGHVYRVEGEFPEENVPTLKVIAYDRGKLMGLRTRNRRWTETTLSGIVTDIGKDYFGPLGVSVDVSGDPQFTGNGIRQTEETDLAFLLRLAQAYGCEMFVDIQNGLEILIFKSQHAIMTSEPDLTLYYGRCGVENRLLTFSANTDVNNVQLSRQYSGMDYDLGEATEMTTADVQEVGSTDDEFADENLAALAQDQPLQAAGITPLMAVAPTAPEELRQYMGTVNREAVPTFTTAADLQARSQNQFSTRIHGMQGNGSVLGNQRIHAQASIDIADVGGQFSGIWYLAQVRHMVDSQGYRTEFECQR